MGATDLIFKLRNDGRSIKADGSYLDISPADNLSAELVQQLKWSKTEILCALYQENELRRLVRLFSDHKGFSQEAYEEAIKIALGDPINALTCYTSLARRANLL